jgi:iron complex outermembrane receptor protein
VISKNKWSSKTSLLYNYCKNDFSFRNTQRYNFPVEKQNNASFSNWGFLQELYYIPTEKSSLSIKLWSMGFYREIQPMKQANHSTIDYDTIRDKNFVTLINFNSRLNWAQVSISGAYLYDHQMFKNDVIATNRWLMRTEMEKNIFSRLKIKAGAYAEYIVPDVYSYGSGIDEYRGDVYLLIHYNASKKLEIHVNLRQSFVSRLQVPFTPSAGIGYLLFNDNTNRLKLRSTLSKSFRAPTLNDKYWAYNGNLDLKPETGLNIEAGFDYDLNTSLLYIQAQASVFQNVVDNWIKWYPRDEWRPENLNKVRAKGFDANIRISLPLKNINISLTNNYAYVNSKIIEAAGLGDIRNGLQLPLLPKHRYNMSAEINHKKGFAQFGLTYSGKTYLSDINDHINSYILAYISAAYNFNLCNNKQLLSLSVRINNLFNAQYESVKYYAMPGRNWNIGLRYTL